MQMLNDKKSFTSSNPKAKKKLTKTQITQRFKQKSGTTIAFTPVEQRNQCFSSKQMSIRLGSISRGRCAFFINPRIIKNEGGNIAFE